MNPERVGRDGTACGCDLRGAAGALFLEESRFTLPPQALTPLETEDGTAYLMLLNPTGGVLGGDYLVTDIVQEAGTHVCLTTPSATRIYRTALHPAVLETAIKLGEGATLEYLPDHVIPHTGAALHQSLRIEMERGSRAIILDSFASGRVAHGGALGSFREMDSRMEVIYLRETSISEPDENHSGHAALPPANRP